MTSNFSRRAFLGTAGAGALAQEVSPRIESGEHRFVDSKRGRHGYRTTPRARRPHVFVLSIDMVSPDHWHPARSMHRDMELPTLRGLAADGVVFSNAFCTGPLCAPARAALATGRYTYIMANNERAHDGHEATLRPDDVIFQEYLKATGYITKHCGKGHLGVQKFFDAFDENVSAWDRWDPPIRSDEEYLMYLRRLKVKPQRYSREIRGLQQDRRTFANSLGGWVEQANGESFPREAQYSNYLAEQAVRKLDAALEQGKGTAPVYLQLDLFDPHQPFSIPAGFDSRERELRARLQLPESYREVRRRDWKSNPEEPKIYDLYRKYWGLYDQKTMEDYRVANALQMEVVDAALGRFIQALKERQLYEEALIIFTADHGEMNGRRAMVDKGVYLVPEVLRVPLTVKPPASWGIRRRTVENVVSHLDVAPTLLEVGGIQPEARLDGQSLMRLLQGDGRIEDRGLLFECGWHVGTNFACAVQRLYPNGEHYLYTYNCASAVDELYDLNSDDAANLTNDRAKADVKKDLIRKLGGVIESDARWQCYRNTFQLDHYFDLPRRQGDLQLKKS
jgi:arylsulfatase A-like enzyme